MVDLIIRPIMSGRFNTEVVLKTCLKMSTVVEVENWFELARVPKGVDYGCAVTMNEHEFLLTTATTHDNSYHLEALLKYNVVNNLWNVLVKYPSNLELPLPGMTYDEQRHKAYIFDGDHIMSIVDLKSNHMKVVKHFTDDKHHYESYPKLLYINGNVHTFSRSDSQGSKHFIWNPDKNKQKFEEMTESIMPPKVSTGFAAMICVPSKEMMLVFGAMTPEQHHNTLYKEEWKVLKEIEVKISFTGTALTSDERYIIIAGGNRIDSIHILEICDNDKFILR